MPINEKTPVGLVVFNGSYVAYSPDYHRIINLDSIFEQITQFSTNDIDDTTYEDIIYVGQEKTNGEWLIKKIDISGPTTIIRGASEVNNPTYTTYVDAWNNRLSLDYTFLKDVI